MNSFDIPAFNRFVEEIDFDDLHFKEVVGRGAFGVVSRAFWRGQDVAVKLIETQSEKVAFITELKQLSRVEHPNIVKLYGACTSSRKPVCLVMEYAEGGSLYSVLHGSEQLPEYNLGHALSWCLQSALGIEYLHGMQPKALIHRDLKPPNLLLVNGGTVLKICDFGTACDAHTHMTNNKGSAAWMAPEVFEGSSYSEKCDVFSWGIILWEVLTRRKPFEDIGGSAFRIMWAVHMGSRPPRIANCPTILDTLMSRCWSVNPVQRPPMSDIVQLMTVLSKNCPGGDEPLSYAQHTEPSSIFDTPPLTEAPTDQRGTCNTLVHAGGEPVPLYIPPTPVTQPVVVEESKRTSAPASLAASRESLLDKSSRASTPSFDKANKRYSADLTKLDHNELMAKGGQKPVKGHRRTGSHDSSGIVVSEIIPLHHAATAPTRLCDELAPSSGADTRRSISWNSPLTSEGAILSSSVDSAPVQQFTDNTSHMALKMGSVQQPLPPYQPCPESVALFNETTRLLEQLKEIEDETIIVSQQKVMLEEKLKQEEKEEETSTKLAHDYQALVSENESLTTFLKNLEQQLNQLKRQ